MKEKSIPIFKTREENLTQNLNWDSLFVQLILKESLAKETIQFIVINYIQ